MSKDIENYSIQECYNELEQLKNPNLPSTDSMYHDMALDVIANRKQRIKERLAKFEHALDELEELKKRDTAMKPVEAMITWQCGKCGKEIRNTFNSCPYCRTIIDWSGIYGSDKDE